MGVLRSDGRATRSPVGGADVTDGRLLDDRENRTPLGQRCGCEKLTERYAPPKRSNKTQRRKKGKENHRSKLNPRMKALLLKG